MTHALTINNREQLMAQQQQLAEQLEDLNKLLDKSGEDLILEAISQQYWYGFKNKREIIFDARTGLLFPNFEYMPFIKFKDWKKEKKEYSPNDVSKGNWRLLYDFWCQDNDIYDQNWSSRNMRFDFPFKYRGQNRIKKNENIFGWGDRGIEIIGQHYIEYNKDHYKVYNNFTSNDNTYNCQGLGEEYYILPTLKILNNPHLLPDYPRLTAHEKAKIILDFFIEHDWIPNFEPFLTQDHGEDDDDFHDRLVQAQIECDEYNRIFAAYYQRIQLQKRLVNLEQQIAQLPEPLPQNLFTSNFNYRQEIQHYNLVEINNSVWQYSKAAQQWLNYLLAQIDDWANRHQHLLAHALELNNILAKKLPSSKHLTEAEQQFLNARHQQLQQTLNFGLDVPRHALIDLLQQAQGVEQQLNTTTSLTLLAQLEQQARPSFSLLAEHSATLCTQTLKKLEWLENSLAFVQAIVTSEQQTTADYLILLDKYQQDLTQHGKDNSVEPEHINAWFAEWRQERLQILQQWQPLIQAGLQGVLSEKTVLDTLACMQDYQQQLDKFYLQNRLGIHTTYAGMPNDNRLEKLGKEQELTKLNHHFMQQLETVIFATATTAQKIWLVRFSDVWQQNIVQEITQFLANQQLIERSDIVQIMSEEMRKLQQQNLVSYLQDAKSYSQALAQREQDVNTLVFKMRKALKV